MRLFTLAVLALFNLIFWGSLLLISVPLKLIPGKNIRPAIRKYLAAIGENWISGNAFLLRRLTPARIRIEGMPEDLSAEKTYVLMANHQSGLDTTILQIVFNRQIPLLRFFVKQQLIFLPILGQAFWALDFPFMKRYSKSQLKKRPELAGRDIQRTREVLSRFRQIPVSIINFVEGTRFTSAKHQRQSSPFTNLLKPKAGGIAMTIAGLNDRIHHFIDVTIHYEGGVKLSDLLRGRISKINVMIRKIELPAYLLNNRYGSDESSTEKVREWLNSLWQEKDLELSKLEKEAANQTA